MDGAAWAALGSFLTALLAGLITGIIKLWNQQFVKNRTVKKDTVEYFERMFERLDRELKEAREENERKDKELYQLQKDCAEERRLCSITVERKDARISYLEELLRANGINFRQQINIADTQKVINDQTIGGKEPK